MPCMYCESYQSFNLTYYNMNLKNLTFLFLIMFLATVSPARAERYQKMAMYISAESVDAIDAPQEKAAAELFRRTFAKDGKFIPPSQTASISVDNYDCIWIHIDRNDIGQDVSSFPEAYRNAEFLGAIEKFHEDGGNLYLSKAAVQLLFSAGVGRVPDYLRPNVFSDGAGAYNADIWSVNAVIGARGSASSAQYYDHTGHAIYSGLETMASNAWPAVKDPVYDENVYSVFPMQGDRNHAAIHREDHNCMWRVAMKSEDALRIGICIGQNGAVKGGPIEEVTTADIDRIEVAEERAVVHYLYRYKQAHPGMSIEIVTPADVKDRINSNFFDCLWVHIDRKGIGLGNLPAEYGNEEFVGLLRDYARTGGNLLLTKQATQLVSRIGRTDAAFSPNLYGDGGGGDGTDVWTVNAQIGYCNATNDPSQFYDRRGHAIYAGMRTNGDFACETYALEGTGTGAAMHRMDHNCLWDLNHYAYSAEGRNTVERFEAQNNAVVLGTWGHVVDYAVAGIVEFNPTSAYRGRIIANGLAAYEWATDGNGFHDNIERMTENCLKYLTLVPDYRFVNDGPDGIVRFEKDANATVLGTWGQDWDHQAAGIVEFRPTREYPANTPDANGWLDQVDYTGKAPKGSIVANGIACVQLHHNDGDNNFQDNVNRLTANTVDYLSPWHERINTGIENVSAAGAGTLRAVRGAIVYSGFDRPVTLSVFAADGRLIHSGEVSGDGCIAVPCHGLVVAVAGDCALKSVM